MKIGKQICSLLVFALAMLACTDELTNVGSSIQPDTDKLQVYVDTFDLETSTIMLDSLYAKTSKAVLGYFDDPKYGSVKSEYLCQFYCPEDYEFRYEPYQGLVDSVDVRIYYSSWMGDSLTSMQTEIYELSKPLESNYYTNIDPLQYCDLSNMLGSKTYSAYDKTVSDSLQSLPSTDVNYYLPRITVKLPQSFGQNFYEATVNNREAFQSQNSFNEFFPGFYVKYSYGVGNMINVDNTRITFYYRHVLESSEGTDSIVNAEEVFNVTKEVLQLNSTSSGHNDQLLQTNEDFSYLKSPAGIVTRIVIPAQLISSKLNGRIVNNAPFSVKATPQEDWAFTLEPPTNLLLIPEDSVQQFFETRSTEDNLTSYISSDYDTYSRTYTFPNLATMLTSQAGQSQDKDMSLLLIPVERTTTVTYDYYGNATEYSTVVSHLMTPSGVTLRTDDESLDLIVTSSKYSD